MPNDRLNLQDVAAGSLNKIVLVYTNNPVPFEGKLMMASNKLLLLDIPNGGTTLHLYIEWDAVTAISTKDLVVG